MNKVIRWLRIRRRLRKLRRFRYKLQYIFESLTERFLRSARELQVSRKGWIIIGQVIVILCLCGFGEFYILPQLKSEPEKIYLLPHYYILLLGTDQNICGQRTDTIIFVHLDTRNQFVDLISLPRDTRVYIPEQGYCKLGHVYAYGGVTMVQKAVEKLIGVKITHYALLQIEGFKKIIDELGGVTIEIEQTMKYEDKKQNLKIDLEKGVQHLDGDKSMQYVRFRGPRLGDIGRIARQQKFIKALLKKVQNELDLHSCPGIFQAVKNNLRTNLKLPLCLLLFSRFRSISWDRIYYFTLPGVPKYINKVSYYLPDKVKISGYRKMLY